MHETGRSTPTHIGTADHRDPADMAAVARLLEGYLRQTEEEKRSFGVEASSPDGLSARYGSEVQDPAGVFADAWTLLARQAEVIAVREDWPFKFSCRAVPHRPVSGFAVGTTRKSQQYVSQLADHAPDQLLNVLPRFAGLTLRTF
jgi:hypothetical protein